MPYHLQRFLFGLIFTILSALGMVQAQSFQNGWIKYGLTYYKFKIAQDGLYKIDQPTLARLGLAQTPVTQFSLWRNGVEVPLYTTSQSGTLSAEGYLEFWGEANDGSTDQSLYNSPEHQLNERWSLFTDSASYFLTADPSSVHPRLQPFANVIPVGATPLSYFIHTQDFSFRERINEGAAAVVGSYIYSSAFDPGEGWSSNDLYAGQTRLLDFVSLFPILTGNLPVPTLKLNLAGNAPNNRTITVKANNLELRSQLLQQFSVARWEMDVPLNELATGEVRVAVSPQQSVSSDRIVIASATLQYARQFNFGGQTRFQFSLPATSSGQYLEIEGVQHGGVAPLLLDITNGQRYETLLTSQGKVAVYLQSASQIRKLVLVRASTASAISTMVPRNFVDYSQPARQGDYLIVSHTALERTATGLPVLEQYRDFRASVAGGSYKSQLYFIDQLEDQFAYGIKRHPNAVRNFIHWSRRQFSAPIKAVLLVGKGVLYTAERGQENNPDLNKLSFIPSFGSPASDLLLATESGALINPKVSIGRVSVISAEEIADYLEKVKQAEQVVRDNTIPAVSKAWTKNVVHIIGVGEEGLGQAITSSMNRFARVLQDTFYGARIHTFSKLSPAPVAQLSAQQIYQLFEDGIGLMTYFGHSTANTLEYNLDHPSGYNNQGKYPFYIMLGCRAGNLFNFNLTRLIEKETISEQFVLAPQRGGIATIASTSLGLVNYLEMQNEAFLKAVSNTHYGQTVGELMNQAALQTLSIAGSGDFLARVHAEQTALNGDPALRFYATSPRPDFFIQPEQLRVSPSPVSVAEGHYNLMVVVRNAGRANRGPLVLEIKRTLPNGVTELWKRDTIFDLYNADTIQYQIPINPALDKGINQLSVCIDPNNIIPELNENNNCNSVSILIVDDELRPVYPSPFAIVNKPVAVFSASAASFFGASRTFRFELDTTTFFNSPMLVTATVQSVGGLVQFKPVIAYRNNTVYYWRVAPISASVSPTWNQASFLYLNGSVTGMGQSHFYQHLASDTVGLRLDSASRQWRYGIRQNNLNIRNGVFFTATSALAGFYLGLNGQDVVMYACARNRLVFNILHPVTLRPLLNALPGQPGRFGSDPVCVQTAAQAVGAAYNFQFNIADTGVRRRIVGFMDSIPDGYYVVVRNIMETNYPPNAYAANWKNDQLFLGAGNSVYHRLYQQGFTEIDSFNRNRVFAFVYKKNQSQQFSPRFAFSNGMYDQLFFSTAISTTDTLGVVKSPVFGPARQWQELHWQGNAETPNRDSVQLSIVGLDQQGQSTLLQSGIMPNQPVLSLNNVDVSRYPYLQLQLTSLDTTHYTPWQLSKWQLLYMPVPEGALSPSQYLLSKDTVEQGEPIALGMAFQNVSEVAFDSLVVQLQITGANNQTQQFSIPKTRPVIAGDTVFVGASIPSATRPGANILMLEVNPQPGQREQYHFNNIAYKSVYVKPDLIAPLLDVTFDGKHIANGQTVLSRPDILISLLDESRWMLLNDTSLVTVTLRYPSGQLRRFNYRSDTLQFFAPSQTTLQNKALVQYRPFLSEMGLYELVVSAKDRAGNKAGLLDYRVTFKVANTAPDLILSFYPNPFSNRTRFSFTLWGNYIPTGVQLQIFNSLGQLVRLVRADALGPLRLGRTVALFEWDGTDQGGHALANGVYSCRVVASSVSGENTPYKKIGDGLLLAAGKVYLQR